MNDVPLIPAMKESYAWGGSQEVVEPVLQVKRLVVTHGSDESCVSHETEDATDSDGFGALALPLGLEKFIEKNGELLALFDGPGNCHLSCVNGVT